MGLSGGKSGGNGALAAKPNILNALQVQTSSYGQVIPILYGQNRIAGRLIWAGDFAAIPHTSTTKVGGKGLGSGGGNAVANTTYTYQTAIAIALCSGPIQNIHNVWDTKGKLTLVVHLCAVHRPRWRRVHNNHPAWLGGISFADWREPNGFVQRL